MISSSGKLNKRLVLSPEGRTRSWLSHLPDEVKYKRVVGHGITAQEFARNPRLDYFFCEGYEQGSAVEIQSNSLDVVQQRAVFPEVFRVLRTGGMFIRILVRQKLKVKASSPSSCSTYTSRVSNNISLYKSPGGINRSVLGGQAESAVEPATE
ncbi:hypothetical protein MLD38_034744 [Melastoma candidum]|uniref:Uncharacterized protein n=1 Tax=Melastoma candidum TaxID=119954 RepID=A0ACB9MBF7_9MYRT|nr:hypothetical protein MLD38_034744 [Melastoma candidum]